MGKQEELKAKAAYHDFEAIFANAQRRKFNEGKLYSPYGQQTSDYKTWVKETVAVLEQRETSNMTARESFLRQIER
jgi:hypothetical protein